MVVEVIIVKKANASFVMLAKMCLGEYFCKKNTNYNNNGRKIIFVAKEWSCFLMQFCDGVYVLKEKCKKI